MTDLFSKNSSSASIGEKNDMLRPPKKTENVLNRNNSAMRFPILLKFSRLVPYGCSRAAELWKYTTLPVKLKMADWNGAQIGHLNRYKSASDCSISPKSVLGSHVEIRQIFKL